ncbi:hypothetical protein O3G_MSEX015062 [Manduca sexta]|uniref:Peptidase S1 domain-containing protein n=2 Tax=Manduca sexta TaxID=7130 RepID=A0A921ZXD4_MANSE|nr:hypothetical protein O3G_MSEX015062 [Manduca sexta]
MQVLAILSFLFLPLAWSSSEQSEILQGWHEKVGIKNAEKIRRLEEQVIASRIVGGVIAPVYSHPYLAGLLIDIIGLSSPSACGGSILTNSRILTAAHCWFDGRFQGRSIQVILGTPFLFHGGVRTHVHAIAIHPHYNFRTFANDIAMLYLPFPIKFTNAIRPIPLPSGELLKANFAEKWLVAAGYGRYSDHSNPSTNAMARNVFLRGISIADCRAVYGEMVLDSNI